MTKKALYLAGGGARGAYQAGVLKAISTILNVKKIPFDMVSGVSVGCINAAILAENAPDFPAATEKLEMLWCDIYCQQIFNASNYEVSKSVLRNLIPMLIRRSQSGYLLDTSPLRNFINENINFNQLNDNIKNNYLTTMEVLSHCYETQQTISFYQHANPEFEDWNYPRHLSLRTELQMEHIVASSALPLFFPAAKIDGSHYGDGSMGLVAPLRGAIRFKVDKILILGTRQLPTSFFYEGTQNGNIGFARILGGMLNSLFMDNLDRDIEMVNRMNEIARLLSLWKKRRSPWRPVQTIHLRPSAPIAPIAQAHYKNMPGLLRFLLNLLGAKSHSGDLLSFLLFEKEFTRELFQLGFDDTLLARDVVLEFFESK
ncbi:patatin family protein [Legionella busanensis]|uniref:Patatin family protein n=1 Tax=Legionella busanensis TaxID=190655 RepID=A0A378JNF5_9GAMM|nr:patatin-like phospholipase family protein [Legionella busanensis]STX52784.1 patatin family protein [Legionella busanensis]